MAQPYAACDWELVPLLFPVPRVLRLRLCLLWVAAVPLVRPRVFGISGLVSIRFRVVRYRPCRRDLACAYPSFVLKLVCFEPTNSPPNLLSLSISHPHPHPPSVIVILDDLGNWAVQPSPLSPRTTKTRPRPLVPSLSLPLSVSPTTTAHSRHQHAYFLTSAFVLGRLPVVCQSITFLFPTSLPSPPHPHRHYSAPRESNATVRQL